MINKYWKPWIKAAGIRALKTVCQAALAAIGSTAHAHGSELGDRVFYCGAGGNCIYFDFVSGTPGSRNEGTIGGITMLKADAIQRVIDIAVGEIGYLEKASADRLDSKTENAGSGNYTKYWRDIYPAYQAPQWCACFVSWVYKKAFGEETAKELLRHWPYVYCPTLANLFTRHANPTVGDIVIFCRNGIFTHTGIVTNVSGDYFETVEGNTSGILWDR